MKWLSDEAVSHLRSLAELPDLSSTRYRLQREIARGGMGVVYLAEDIELGRPVAIKVLSPELSTAEAGARMEREARVLARLDHPGVVPIHEVGRLPDGRVFYAMKLVRGSSLDEVTRTAPTTDLLRIFLRVCEAIAYAHAHGVIHRDLKPENIMVGEFGEVLVMDWGVAKIREEGEERSEEASESPPPPLSLSPPHTASGTIIGTRGYMSPEQSRGEVEQIDARSDVYALGAILQYLFDGRESPVPRPIASICQRAMSEQKEERYGSAQEMYEEIVRYLDGERVRAHRETPLEKAARWVNRYRIPIAIVGAYLLMRVILFLWLRR